LCCRKRSGLKRTLFFAGGEAISALEYTDFGRVTEFRYGAELGKAFRGNNPIKYLQNFGMSKKVYNFPISVKFIIEIFTTDKQTRMAKFSYKSIAFVGIISSNSTALPH
jgi:hypothetical protein